MYAFSDKIQIKIKMEENRLNNINSQKEQEQEQSFLNLQYFLSTFILNWKWFVLSLIVCMGVAFAYLRYTTPTYSVSAKFLIKDDDNGYSSRSKNALLNSANLGIMTTTDGFDNELEILQSLSLTKDAIKNIKAYATYASDGKFKDVLIYKTQPINIDLDAYHLDQLETAVNFKITKNGANDYSVNIKYANKEDDKIYEINKDVQHFPVLIRTQLGLITLTTNGKYFTYFEEGQTLKATIENPDKVASQFLSRLNVAPSSKTTTIAVLSVIDPSVERAKDYLSTLAFVYNSRANDDKNEIAVRTEEFINERLRKIDNELGSTDKDIASYKQRNNMVDVAANAQKNMTGSATYESQLVEAQTQMMLLNSIVDYMNQSHNKYQTLPSNVGLTDQAATSLIHEYNAIVLERNRLLRTASEKSPAVVTLTFQLDDLALSIREAVAQNTKSQQIRINSLSQQLNKYTGQVSQVPEQERILTQIGREQEVKSSLYIMLLQKREENSISLAATADKGKLIDDPAYGGKVSPKGMMILCIALLLAFAIPFLFFILKEYMRYRIEGHEDVAKITKLPIIADIPVANDTAKQKADIVVHENQNNQMEEIFRSLRTNLNFVMKEGEKVIMFTSSKSGEGKTFVAANLAVSFALLGKKVILVGLDIRRPRLSELFELNDKKHGITNLLRLNEVTEADVRGQIIPSGVNDKLDLLMAGPIPPNPAELVERQTLDQTFGILNNNYDYIIVDTAPVGLVTDTLSIGRVANATVYVCRADYTEKAALAAVNELADENKLPNLNVIINGIDMSKNKYSYAYGYGKYGKYSYGKYGHYGKYGKYGYHSYGYGNYHDSHYGNKNDTSIKL